ncbi:hypothetical protein KMW28_04360 [Flammeovirga yaeyamensis]|uniref:Uncharacterized protein n=1 Tax=Flammeovirga yaeyamensis TaxID=367791 RepID=A0AAX1N8T0_9BACT|nr:hypothetical protein [Flammeovirga yaeyamensis]MBB3697389.1 hypothetical protein [Flammeovirga yaeyamensis]NMF36083.1 hypothetical protein [Flammeovirga yaeyamensis]QWG02816.1 hypothetical protein KMW28_04360 [Flammeovirga yaeyamensis]
MIYILDKLNKQLIPSEIQSLNAHNIPLKKDGWNFNWKDLSKIGKVFILKVKDESISKIEGAICLRIENKMLIMEALEIAPENIGKVNKRYDYVAGCLIAFACRESFKIEGDYKGFLTFTSKTKLIHWYMSRYGAEVALGNRMFIDWEAGEKLIKEYLKRSK